MDTFVYAVKFNRIVIGCDFTSIIFQACAAFNIWTEHKIVYQINVFKWRTKWPWACIKWAHYNRMSCQIQPIFKVAISLFDWICFYYRNDWKMFKHKKCDEPREKKKSAIKINKWFGPQGSVQKMATKIKNKNACEASRRFYGLVCPLFIIPLRQRKKHQHILCPQLIPLHKRMLNMTEGVKNLFQTAAHKTTRWKFNANFRCFALPWQTE